ncbi:MAG: DUF3857 domain-containing transglutaminase family protein [Pyrinomonadaceae bacterium]
MQLVFLRSARLSVARLAIVASGFLVFSVSQPAYAKPSFVVRPPQPWVRTIDPESTTKGAQTPTGGSSFILDDHQIRVGEKTVDRYYHHVQRVDTAAGLDDVSQLRFYFEPSYQQLTIHFIRIQREAETIDAFKPSEVKVIQQEKELDQQLYNGTLAALIFLNDLRVGDIVDYSYSISGENPVLGGRFAETFYLADSQPIQHLTCRLLWPSTRALSVKNTNIGIEPEVRSSDGETEYFWERRNVAGITVEDSIPAWFEPYPTISLSQFQTWQDVVQWALPLYNVSGPNPPELAAKTERWRADFASPEQRAVAALRFVQDDIRYLGIELGRYSHQPTEPAKVLSRRFGDCKDKSLLLTSILRSLEIDAAPALVNTSAGRSLDNRQASPFSFDHVIVQARINGKTYWFDPTMSYQRGPLDQYYDPPYERALVLRDNSVNLDKIPFPSNHAGSVVVKEVYQAPNIEGPISFVVTTTYRGAEADYMRYSLSGYSLTDLGKKYLNYYADENPLIKAEGLPQIADDQNSNVLVLTERYRIEQFWKDEKHSFYAERIYQELGKPQISQRSMPLKLRYPLSLDHIIEINLNKHFAIPLDRGTISDDSLRFEYGYSNQSNAIRLQYSLKTFADSVPLEKVQRHLEVLDQIQDRVGFELYRSSDPVFAFASKGRTRFFEAVVGFVFLSIVGTLAFVFIRNRLKNRRESSRGAPIQARAGTTPETAIPLQDDEEMETFLRKYECACGQRPYGQGSAPVTERFTYDGQRLVGIRLPCSSCGMNNDLYLNSLANQPMGH